MMAVPAVIPVTTPLVAPITATPGVELVQVPPLVVLVHVCDEPIQIGVVPVMVWGTGDVMVTICVAILTHPPTVTE